MSDRKIAVVIPAYKVPDQIRGVVEAIPQHIHHIIVVDDHCPQSSGKEAERSGRENLTVLYHRRNRGVGAAVVTGYKKALELGCDIVVKIDGDGQMDPVHIGDLIDPLTRDTADYCKGNRFRGYRALKSMPKIRLLGNSGLSFLIKGASGYWNIMDPTNGYTAVHRRVLEKLILDRLSKRYFFETDMLFHLNLINAVVKDIDISAKYANENSSLSTGKALLQFPPRLLLRMIRRIFLKYYVYDFNMASVYILIGLPVFLASSIYGILEWIESAVTGVPRSAGTIMLVALPIIISFQMLLQAIQIDINSVPKKDHPS
jgi:glycosyltransferase involved in cell wall biosynthesis